MLKSTAGKSGGSRKRQKQTENAGEVFDSEPSQYLGAKPSPPLATGLARVVAQPGTGFNYQKATPTGYPSAGNDICSDNTPSVLARLNAFQAHTDKRFAELHLRLEDGINTATRRYEAIADKINHFLPEIAKINDLLPQLLAEAKSQNSKNALVALSKEFAKVTQDIHEMGPEVFPKPPIHHLIGEVATQAQLMPHMTRNPHQQINDTDDIRDINDNPEPITSEGLVAKGSANEFAYYSPANSRPNLAPTLGVKKMLRFSDTTILKLQSGPHDNMLPLQYSGTNDHSIGLHQAQNSSDFGHLQRRRIDTGSLVHQAPPEMSESVTTRSSSSSGSKSSNVMSHSRDASLTSMEESFQNHDQGNVQAAESPDRFNILTGAQQSSNKRKIGSLTEEENTDDAPYDDDTKKGFPRPKRNTSVPQYKLEKSLKSVREIWQEYEYGLKGKPPLKLLEAEYSAKWRDETESRTFLRRKRIYEAIEKGKRDGYDEATIIGELEEARTYSHLNDVKRRPLQWLCRNIPQKFRPETNLKTEMGGFSS